MTDEARYCKADIQRRRVVQAVKRAGNHLEIVTATETIEADYVLSTLSVGALGSRGVQSTERRRSASRCSIRHPI